MVLPLLCRAILFEWAIAWPIVVFLEEGDKIEQTIDFSRYRSTTLGHAFGSPIGQGRLGCIEEGGRHFDGDLHCADKERGLQNCLPLFVKCVVIYKGIFIPATTFVRPEEFIYSLFFWDQTGKTTPDGIGCGVMCNGQWP